MSRLAELAKKSLATLVTEGPTAFAKESSRFTRNRWRPSHPFVRRLEVSRELFETNGYNLCHNRQIPNDYDPDANNVLVAIESPAVVEYEGWLDPDMEFCAEISFGNFYDLELYYCPRSLYVGNDNFLELDQSRDYVEKHDLVSLIYSSKDHLEGHQLRYRIADAVGDDVDIYGSGSGKYTEKFWSEKYQAYLEDKSASLESYMFQIVVENGKYPEYVSEKFFDAVKTKTVPIYWGGERAIEKLGFDLDGVLLFDGLEDLRETLKEVSASLYEEKRSAVETNFERLVELRNRQKMEFYLNSVVQHYLHSKESYHQRKFDELALGFD